MTAGRIDEAGAPLPDWLEAEAYSPLGERPFLLLDAADPESPVRAAKLRDRTRAILIAIDRPGALPDVDPASYDLLLTSAAAAARPWVYVPAGRFDERVEGIGAIVSQAPIAASVLCHLLRVSEAMALRDAITMESLAYSTLLGGGEFARWLAARKAAPPPPEAGPFVQMAREGDDVTVRLARPAGRNPICAGMRDALFEALAAVLDDPSMPRLRIEGLGSSFSTGGMLAEFGTARDLAQAHAVRTLRSCAVLLDALGDRAEVVLHGACVGSGIEIPAAAHRRLARPGAFFHLPELRMGLIPGAGGTATIARAIGRHRAAYMALSARRIDTETALEWGLVHALLPAGPNEGNS
jgi:enoyl-CoA hydratase/carnithine racemase